MSEPNAVVAIYDTQVGAEEAVKELQRAGLDMNALSIVAKDTHSDGPVVSYFTNSDRMKYWGKTGAFWGAFWGMTFGSGILGIRGIGPLLASGPLVECIIGGLEGALLFGGLGVIGAWLYSMAVAKVSVVQHELALKTDRFLLMVHGTASEVGKARDVIETTRPVHITLHAPEIEMSVR